MPDPVDPVDSVGIIGGGQLGRMLAMAAARLGIDVVVLDPAVDAPAAVVAGEHIVAAYDDHDALDRLAERCGVVTYEFENVPVTAVEHLAASVAVYPDARALATSQDRLVEKTFLQSIGIATAPFHRVDDQDQLDAAVADLGGRAILKTRTLGYDGKGQLRIGPERDPVGAFAELGSVPLIAEGFVDFVAELSVIIARSPSGEIRWFDPARNVHRDGILRTSTVPSGLGATVEEAAVDAAVLLVDALGYVGVLGLELFVTADGSVVANEYAPRVHNSGHWTEGACVISQFEQHVRAVTGRPLGIPGRWADAVMTNLIGSDVDLVPELLAAGDRLVHLYGKGEVRPGRKMGHVVALSPRVGV